MTLSIPSARAVIAAATPGPWCVQGPWPHATVYVAYDGDAAAQIASLPLILRSDQQCCDNADAAFIAAARTGWPEALDRIEALEAGITDFMARFDDAVDTGDVIRAAEKLRSLLASKESP